MITKKIAFNSFDQKPLYLVHWMPENPIAIKGVLQLVHGMAEHIGRYERLARYLCEHGIAVYGYDQRGHGKSVGKEDVVGFIAEENGWDIYLQDVHAVNEYIVGQHPQTPIFIMGHSMGALITTAYRQKYDNQNVSGFIHSALAFQQSGLSKLGKGVAKIQRLFKGSISQAKLHNYLSFGSFNKAFKPNRTEFDWLSRDEEEVDRYLADPYCGAVFTVQFFDDLLTGIIGVYQPENLDRVNPLVPVFLFAGTDDPVIGGMKKFEATQQLFSQYTQDFSVKLYPGGRHEMLNETNREEVMADILNWIKKHLN